MVQSDSMAHNISYLYLGADINQLTFVSFVIIIICDYG